MPSINIKPENQLLLDMETKIVCSSSPDALLLAIRFLRASDLVAFPTDTVYGVGALAFDATAVDKIYATKGRSAEKAIPVLIGDPDDLTKVTAEVPEIASKLASRFWPGPLTLVVPKHPNLPEAISSMPTVGVRVPDHAVARALLRTAGPMAVTSANVSGQTNPSTAEEVFAQLGGRIALIIDGGKTPGGVPSTVVDCISTQLIILREGPISKDEILAILHGKF